MPYDLNKFDPIGFYIDRNNYMFIFEKSKKQILLWTEYNSQPSQSFHADLTRDQHLFIDGKQRIRIDRCPKNISTKNNITVIDTDGKLFGLLIKNDESQFCMMTKGAGKKLRSPLQTMVHPASGLLITDDFHVYLSSIIILQIYSRRKILIRS